MGGSMAENTQSRPQNNIDLEDQDYDAPEPHAFNNIFHEIVFIMIVVFSQMITQANLGNTVLPISSISSGLGATTASEKSWFLASYSCTAGAFVLITGRLGDMYGKKLFFVLGWAWMAAWTLGAGFAKKQVVFDICRAFAGMGPATLMPNSAALLGVAFSPGARKNLAFSIFGAIAPVGFFIGGVWGSAITQSGIGWRWIYWSMAILCGTISLISIFVVPNALNHAHGGTFDFLGSFLGVSGLVLIFVAVSGGPTWSWDKPYTGILLGLGVLSIFTFVFVENRVKDPVLPMSLFTSPTFSAVILCLCLGWMSFGFFQYYLPQFLETFRHHSQLSTAIQFLPVTLVGPIACFLVITFLPRVPVYVIFGSSMLAFCLGAILLALQPVNQTYWQMTFPAMVIITFGPDMSFTSASLIVSDSVPKHVQGVAGSFVNTTVNYAIALGLALAGNLEASVTEKKGQLEGFRAAWWLGAAFGGTGLLMTAIVHKGMARKHGKREH